MSRGEAVGTTWRCRGDGSRRRRGDDAEIPRRQVARLRYDAWRRRAASRRSRDDASRDASRHDDAATLRRHAAPPTLAAAASFGEIGAAADFAVLADQPVAILAEDPRPGSLRRPTRPPLAERTNAPRPAVARKPLRLLRAPRRFEDIVMPSLE